MAAVVEGNGPLPENKPTRQWDAWTREEEENFFGALRQVGKNFEKITSRVQSKNKDQVLWTPLPVRQPDQHKAPALVRHYYYRVIKRMNRILAPSLILDAKNSSYVNSAMLRWWSLLEKHSCSASKLRLKPRRFKTFVTALEHQLLKDRKKTKKKTPASTSSRKHSSQAEAAVVALNELVDNGNNGLGLSKGSADDLESLPTGGGGRRVAVKRKAASNVSRKAGAKGEAKRPPRPRKKPTDGNHSKAAYAKWEKAATIGVSLMAEAAEHLERAAAAEGVSPASDTPKTHWSSDIRDDNVNVDIQTGHVSSATSAAFSELGLLDKLPKDFPGGRSQQRPGLGGVTVVSGSSGGISTCPPSHISKGELPSVYEGQSGGLVIIPELCAEATAKSLALLATRCNNCSTLRCNAAEEARNDTTGAKLKLQLFPFDDVTRKALEQDGHNPHLELTFKARKSISSVLHHLTQKWGRSTVAFGELRLFPFNAQWSNISACQSWSSQDSEITAADVHAALGNPAVFRLRYAWLTSRVLEASSAVLQQQHTPVLRKATGSVTLLQTGGSLCEIRNSTSQSVSALPFSTSLGSSGTTVPGPGVISPDQCRPSEQTDNGTVTGAVCKVKDTRTMTPSLVVVPRSAGVIEQSAVQCPILMDKSSVCTVLASEDQVAVKLSPVIGTGDSNVEKDFGQPVTTDLFANCESENVERSNCRDQEATNQISGCAWLYESSDGFGPHLWNIEDPLRSNNGVSIAQMDWVDSLTNISVSELLGEASRAGFSVPLDGPHACASQGQPVLACMDSFDISVAAQEVRTPGSMNQGSSAIWGGEETCDAFSFQRNDHSSRDTANVIGHEISVSSFGLDVSFSDFRGMGCWKESSQNQDLLFGGEASMGLGGLIEALAQGSLDGFQSCCMNHSPDEGGIDSGNKKGSETLTKALSEGREIPVGVMGYLSEQDKSDLCIDNRKLIGEASKVAPQILFSTTGSSQSVESQKVGRPMSAQVQRQKDIRPPPRTFKLPGQYSNVRPLKLQS